MTVTIDAPSVPTKGSESFIRKPTRENASAVGATFGSKATADFLVYRMDGRIEKLCVHGVGHPVDAPKSLKLLGESWKVHGCCHEGCCSKW